MVVPFGRFVVVMVRPEVMVMESTTPGEVFPALSLTVTVKLEVPAVLAEPLITPVDEFRVRPAGNDPTVTVQEL